MVTKLIYASHVRRRVLYVDITMTFKMADLMLEYRWLYRLRVSRPYIGGRKVGLSIGQTFIDVVSSKGAVCLFLEF